MILNPDTNPTIMNSTILNPTIQNPTIPSRTIWNHNILQHLYVNVLEALCSVASIFRWSTIDYHVWPRRKFHLPHLIRRFNLCIDITSCQTLCLNMVSTIHQHWNGQAPPGSVCMSQWMGWNEQHFANLNLTLNLVSPDPRDRSDITGHGRHIADITVWWFKWKTVPHL